LQVVFQRSGGHAADPHGVASAHRSAGAWLCSNRRLAAAGSPRRIGPERC